MGNKRMLKICTYFLVMVLVTMSILAACAQTAPAPSSVIIASSTELQSLDPTMSRMAPLNMPILANIYDPLVATTPEGKPVSGIGITSWQVLDGGKVFEFTLRKGIKFSSGDPMTMKDIEFTYNRAMKNNPEFPSLLRNFDRLEVIDDYNCRFIFKQPDVLFLPLLCPLFLVVSKSYYDRVGEDTFVKNPVGSGPYKYVEWKSGQYVDLVANEDYWGPKPQVKQAHILFVTEPTTKVAMLQAGEVDIALNISWELVGSLEKAGFKTMKTLGVAGVGVQFHNKNPKVPWYDKRVRQAFAYAIDREAISKNLFYGIPPVYAWLSPGEVGYDPSLKPYPYDPAKAKALLAEAGYPNGFEMKLYYRTVVTGVKETAEAVLLQLKAVGINAELIAVEHATIMEQIRKWSQDTNAEVVMVMNTGVAGQAESVRALQQQIYGKNPTAVFTNNELDALIDKALITVDDTQRGEVLKQAFRLMQDELPIAPILSNVVVDAMKSNIDFVQGKATRMYIDSIKIK